jgi:hypothetical protein
VRQVRFHTAATRIWFRLIWRELRNESTKIPRTRPQAGQRHCRVFTDIMGGYGRSCSCSDSAGISSVGHQAPAVFLSNEKVACWYSGSARNLPTRAC